MKIKALNTFSGILDLSALERLQEYNPDEKIPLRLYIRPGEIVEVTDRFYGLARVQDAIRLGYIEVGNVPDVPSQNQTLIDSSFIGTTLSLTAGEDLSLGEVVYFNADGKVYKAFGTGRTTMPCVGMVTAAADIDTSVTLLIDGMIRSSSAFSFTVGGQVSQSETASIVYVSETTAGDVTQILSITSGHIIQIVGYAVTTDVLNFKLDHSYVERA